MFDKPCQQFFGIHVEGQEDSTKVVFQEESGAPIAHETVMENLAAVIKDLYAKISGDTVVEVTYGCISCGHENMFMNTTISPDDTLEMPLDELAAAFAEVIFDGYQMQVYAQRQMRNPLAGLAAAFGGGGVIEINSEEDLDAALSAIFGSIMN